MRRSGSKLIRLSGAVLLAAAAVCLAPAAGAEGEATAGSSSQPAPFRVANSPALATFDALPSVFGNTYAPRDEPWSYNSDYFFGLSRGLANSSLVPAARVPLFILTVPLDIVLLPFAAIAGLFG